MGCAQASTGSSGVLKAQGRQKQAPVPPTAVKELRQLRQHPSTKSSVHHEVSAPTGAESLISFNSMSAPCGRSDSELSARAPSRNSHQKQSYQVNGAEPPDKEMTDEHIERLNKFLRVVHLQPEKFAGTILARREWSWRYVGDTDDRMMCARLTSQESSKRMPTRMSQAATSQAGSDGQDQCMSFSPSSDDMASGKTPSVPKLRITLQL
mmetsp:Transcript_6325/g.13833  ORF Transcript_6325/g.13833 Transcript_6325/m.13833 type:complete len:209 (-) Transcript_6325:89-715(-)